MKIIKRSGMEDTFDIKKIEAAIRKANESVIDYEKLTEEKIQEIKMVSAQAADELLGIEDVDASFVFYYESDDVVAYSARSMGRINVQIIMEKLGGGGNAATAGAQVKNHTVQQTLDELLQSINKFYES